MEALILIKKINKRNELNNFIEILMNLKLNKIYFKDINFYNLLKNKISLPVEFLTESSRNELIKKDEVLIINNKFIDKKGIELLYKFHKKNSISALIKFKENIKNSNVIQIEQNYNAIDLRMYGNKIDGFVSSEIFICTARLLKPVFEKIKKSDYLFEFFYENKKSIKQIFCLPYNRCEKNLKSKTERKIAFLDRDGIIIEDNKYPHKKEDLVIKNGIIDFLNKLKNEGFEFIIITNQAGIARRKFTLPQFKKFQKMVINELLKNKIKILDVFYCPYLKDADVKKYNYNSLSRKPNPGMILKALLKYNINLKESFMVGDRESDVILLPYLKSFLIKGSYKLNRKLKVYKNFDEVFNVLKKNKKKNGKQNEINRF